DLDGLAELVASRTSEALAQGSSGPATLSSDGLDEIEARVARAVKAAAARADAGDDAVRRSIEEVNARLARLEESLTRPAAPAATAPLPEAVPAAPVETAPPPPAEASPAPATSAKPAED